MAQIEISLDDPRAADVLVLLERHLRFAHEQSPADDVHALDLDGLLTRSITFFSCRSDGRLLGVGALQELDVRHGELKSMHTAAEARGRGRGPDDGPAPGRCRPHVWVRAGQPRDRDDGGVRRRLRLAYASEGFRVCPPFNGYWDSPYSVCMTLALVG